MIPRKIGQKKINVVLKEKFLNNWFERPKGKIPTVPFKSAIEIGQERVEWLSEGALGYQLACSNDLQQASMLTAFFSGSFGGGHGWSITPDNFAYSFVTCCVRKVVDPSWTNNRDQFRQPNCSLPEDFISSCVLWCLFNGCNNTSSLKDVEYKGKTYQVRNQFFPYLLSELREWDTPHDLSGQIRTAQDTFVASWLKGRTLSPEAQALLDAGHKVYQVFYKEWKNLNQRKFKIDYWDCGWYQIRNALLDAKLGLEELNAVKEAHTKLANKLRPKVYEYGFLDQSYDKY